MSTLMGYPKFRGQTKNGIALAGGLLYTYAAGTLDERVTYSDAELTVENTNPVVLDINGECVLFLDGKYKFILKDADGNLQWTLDGIYGLSSSSVLLVNEEDTTPLSVTQSVPLAAGENLLYLLSTAALTAGGSHLAYLNMANAASTTDVTHILNSGTGNAIYVSQIGVSAANKHAMYIYSDAVQNTSSLVKIHQSNAGSDQHALEVIGTTSLTGDMSIVGDIGLTGGVHITISGVEEGFKVISTSTNYASIIYQNEVLATGKNAFCVESNASQTNAALVKFTNTDSGSTRDILTIPNYGSGTAVNVNVHGELAVGEFGVHIHSIIPQTNAVLFDITQDHADSTKGCIELNNDGSGVTFKINQTGAANAFSISNSGAKHGFLITQSAELDTSRYCFYINNTFAQTNSQLMYINSANASSTADVSRITNAGTGNGLVITQTGILATSNRGLKVTSTTAQIYSPIFEAISTNAGSTWGVAKVLNQGTGYGLYINQDKTLATNKYGLHVYSNKAQTNSALTKIEVDNVSSDQPAVLIINRGTGVALRVVGTQAGGMEIQNRQPGGYCASYANQGDTPDSYGISMIAGDTLGSGTTLYFTAKDRDTDPVGYLANVGGTFQLVDVSDVRTKKDVQRSRTDAFSIIKNTEIREYIRKKSGEFVPYGIIADEALSVLPSAVAGRPGEKEFYTEKEATGEVRVYEDNLKSYKVTHKNISMKDVLKNKIKGEFVETSPEVIGERDKMMGVNYTAYVMPLIMVVQTLMEDVENLKRRIKNG